MEKLIIIIGASGGIGNYLFNYYTNLGLLVIGTSHNNKIDRLVSLDITNYIEVKKFVESIKTKNKEIILINCAGINYNAFCHKSNPIDWGKVIDVNIKGGYNITSLLLPYMRNNNCGAIIYFSSVVAQIGVVGTSAYASSKSALWGLAKSIAVENASKNITCNCINLGYFDIGMIKDVSQNIKELIIDKIPFKKLGNQNEIIRTIDYLIKCKYITGTSIDLNGGLY